VKALHVTAVKRLFTVDAVLGDSTTDHAAPSQRMINVWLTLFDLA